MTRYDTVFAVLAERAVDQATVDLQTFIRLQIETGTAPDQIVANLLDDIDDAGSIFGKFVRSIKGAATSSVMAAARQGEMMGALDVKLTALAGDKAAARAAAIRKVRGSVARSFQRKEPTAGKPTFRQTRAPDDTIEGQEDALLEHLDRAMRDADPESAAVIEDLVLGEQRYTWIAALKNTCHKCLPLHGRTEKLADWRARGVLPENIHAGWTSSCYCRLVPAENAESRAELMAPLKRVKPEKGSKRTQRAIAEKDVMTAQAARDKSMESLEGRRMLRRLGQSGATESDEQ